jgi:hypothetical protein
VRVGVASDRQRVAAVDQDVPLRMADQEERHRYLDAPEAERAAVEQIKRNAARHSAILCRATVRRRSRTYQHYVPQIVGDLCSVSGIAVDLVK